MIAVIAEFNPFHNGHKYQIDKIRKKYKDDVVVAIISSNITQRGDFSILDKFERANLAIKNGYDLVVELPIYYSYQNAEIFSEKSTLILNELKIKKQICGIENNSEDVYLLKEISETQNFKEKVKEKLKMGYNYKISIREVLKDMKLENLYKSNNILAVEYLKSIEKYNLEIELEFIKRKSVSYIDEEIKNDIASATYIRKNISNLEEIIKVVPEETFISLNKKIEIDYNLYFNLLKYQFLMKKNELLDIYDINDEIYTILNKIIISSNTYKEYIEKRKFKNISENRLNRIEKNILLNIKKEFIKKGNNIEYIRVLALNERGAKYLKKLNNPKIYSNFKDIDKKNINNFKINIEKNMFMLYNMLTQKNEKLNNIYVRRD